MSPWECHRLAFKSDRHALRLKIVTDEGHPVCLVNRAGSPGGEEAAALISMAPAMLDAIKVAARGELRADCAALLLVELYQRLAHIQTGDPTE